MRASKSKIMYSNGDTCREKSIPQRLSPDTNVAPLGKRRKHVNQKTKIARPINSLRGRLSAHLSEALVEKSTAGTKGRTIEMGKKMISIRLHTQY